MFQLVLRGKSLHAPVPLKRHRGLLGEEQYHVLPSLRGVQYRDLLKDLHAFHVPHHYRGRKHKEQFRK